MECRALRAEAAAREAAESVARCHVFIAAIGRELGNQIGPVALSVERLRGIVHGADPARIEAAIGMVEHACETLESRARSLMDFVPMASGIFEVALEEFDASALLSDLARRHAETARRAGCVLELAVPPGIMLLANRAALRQVLEHLLSNALKFGAGRPVRLSAAARTTGVAIAICDGGPGVPDEDATRIFGLLDHARPAGTPGLGIGLWAGRQLAAAMGATLDLVRPPDGGACFELSFGRDGLIGRDDETAPIRHKA
jgi:signal transduction histidine kinase